MWPVILIPFLGTCLGAACVFFFKNSIGDKTQRILTGFAAGVMTAVSFLGLLQPALEQSREEMGNLGFIPPSVGFAVGMLFLLVLDMLVPHVHRENSEGVKSGLKRTTKLVLAVTLHNIPEGMAVGIICAGWLYGGASVSFMGALTLAIGIAIQNFPEGAIVSMPLLAEGESRGKTFLYGVLSGIVEPIAALVVIFVAGAVVPVMPYFLSFAAGAMIYVVVEELIPEMSKGSHSNAGTISFAAGFVAMLILEVGLS